MNKKLINKLLLVTYIISFGILLGIFTVSFSIHASNIDNTSTTDSSLVSNNSNNIIQNNSHSTLVKNKVINNENLNGTTTSIPKKDIVENHDYGYYYNMRPIYNKERTIRGNTKVTFSHPMYLHYAEYTHYKFGKPFGDPQSMIILPNGRLYVLFNVGHGDSTLNRILEYDIKNKKLLHIGHIFHSGHGQGLSYDANNHKMLICANNFTPHHHGVLHGDLLITNIGKKTLKPYGKIIHIHAPKNMSLGDNFTCDYNGKYYNVAKYGNDKPYSSYGGLSIYRGYKDRMIFKKLLFHSPSSTVQNIEFNPLTRRIYIIGNNCITSFPVNKLNHLNNKDIRVSIFNNPVEFESLAFYKNRAYLLLNKPSRILISNKLF